MILEMNEPDQGNSQRPLETASLANSGLEKQMTPSDKSNDTATKQQQNKNIGPENRNGGR
jgi:hypothetical protein